MYFHTKENTISIYYSSIWMLIALYFSVILWVMVSKYFKRKSLLHTSGKEGLEVEMFTYPCGIALTNDLNLVVVSSDQNHSLRIYSRDQVLVLFVCY